jgi:hypothetical protein
MLGEVGQHTPVIEDRDPRRVPRSGAQLADSRRSTAVALGELRPLADGGGPRPVLDCARMRPGRGFGRSCSGRRAPRPSPRRTCARQRGAEGRRARWWSRDRDGCRAGGSRGVEVAARRLHLGDRRAWLHRLQARGAAAVSGRHRESPLPSSRARRVTARTTSRLQVVLKEHYTGCRFPMPPCSCRRDRRLRTAAQPEDRRGR